MPAGRRRPPALLTILLIFVAIAVIILMEKQWRHGAMLARLVGAGSIAVGLFLALRATIPP